MNPTRRGFLKTGTGAVVASVLGFDVKTAYAQAKELKIARTTETRSTCPYCSVSCGVIIHTLGDKAKNVTPRWCTSKATRIIPSIAARCVPKDRR